MNSYANFFPRPRLMTLLSWRPMNLAKAGVIALLVGMPFDAFAAGNIVQVGPSFDIKLPSEAARIVDNGDIVEIEAGRYSGDVAVWRAHDLTIRSVGGLAVLDAAGRSAQGKAIWVIDGENVTVEGIEFRNAKVRDRNGAGIRAQGRHLTVKNSVFAYNENGILSSDDSESNFVIMNSSFIGNGYGDGRSHGIYIGVANSLIFKHNYVYGTMVGHHVKTRARLNEISYNFLIDGRSGSASYAIDMPNAELGIAVGNIIHQGENTENYHVVHMNAVYDNASLMLVNNTVVNEYRSGHLFRLGGEAIETHIVNNAIAGRLDVTAGNASHTGNIAIDFSDFVNADAYDYRLRSGSKAIDSAGSVPSFRGVSLKPHFEYRHPARTVGRPTIRVLDAGALEFQAE